MSVLYVSQQGAYVRKSGGRIVVTRKDEELAALPETAVDGVVLLGHVQISTQAVHVLLQRGVPVVYLSRSGAFRGLLQPGYPKQTAVRLAQYEAALDPARSLEIARAFVAAKFEAALLCERKWRRNRWLGSHACGGITPTDFARLSAAESLAAVRAAEALAARAHFEAFAQTLKNELCAQAEELIDPETDSLRLYPLFGDSRSKQTLLGNGAIPDFPKACIV